MSCYGKLVPVGALVLALGAGACGRESGDTVVRDEAGRSADAAADLERERTEVVADLRERVAEIEREYAEASREVASGEKTATAGLREELQEDMAAVRAAVEDLGTTNAENWWDRHERALERNVSDIEADVRRLAGKLSPVREEQATGTVGEAPSAEPFTSRRDAFVTRLRARVEAMEEALERVDAKGARETELDDTRARVKKLREDADRLNSAAADDWWELSRERVTEYLDRVEGSVDRLDDNAAGD